MSNRTLVNLATVGSDELQAMPITVFTTCLEQMSAEAVDRFQRLRKLNASQRAAVEQFLAQKTGKPAPALRGVAKRPSSTDTKQKDGEAGAKGPVQVSLWMDLMLRLLAWWEGVDTDALARARGIKRWRRPTKPKSTSAAPTAPAAIPKEKPTEALPPLTRVELVQKLWGEGFSLPGGEAFALRVARAATPPKNALCLDLAPGLGGGMRAAARTLGVRIKGIECDRELAEAAALLSSGMGDRAPIRAGYDGLDPEDFEPAGGHAAIFMREAMFAVEDRERMLAAMHEFLTEDGSLILTDFVVTGDGDAVAHWQAVEPNDADPWTEAEYREALEVQHYRIERFDDLTREYLPLIKEGLRRFHDCLQNVKLPPETVPILMREGNLWLARSQALETGQLSFVHIHARRVSPPVEREGEYDEHG